MLRPVLGRWVWNPLNRPPPHRGLMLIQIPHPRRNPGELYRLVVIPGREGLHEVEMPSYTGRIPWEGFPSCGFAYKTRPRASVTRSIGGLVPGSPFTKGIRCIVANCSLFPPFVVFGIPGPTAFFSPPFVVWDTSLLDSRRGKFSQHDSRRGLFPSSSNSSSRSSSGGSFLLSRS